MIALDIDTTTHTVGQAVWLFENLLQHKVGIPTLLYLSQINIYRLHLQVLLLAQNAKHLEVFTLTYDSYITIFKIDNLIGILNDWTGIGTKEKLVLTNAHHQRTLLASSNNLAGVALIDNSNGISTYHLIKSHLYGLQQRELLLDHYVFDQLYEYLSICIALELNTLTDEFCLDVSIILDYTVVDNSQIMTLGIVRMGITTGRFTMGSPTGMGYTNMTRHILVTTILSQIINLSLCLVNIQFVTFVNQSNTSRIVTTIL